MMHTEDRPLVLRDEVDGKDVRHLSAYVDEKGDLHIDGQDLGPGTAIVSGDGEYEWYQVIDAADVPRLVAALGGEAGTDVMALLAERHTGAGSYELERIIRESDIPVKRRVWSG